MGTGETLFSDNVTRRIRGDLGPTWLTPNIDVVNTPTPVEYV
jgi:hypothetical protein